MTHNRYYTPHLTTSHNTYDIDDTEHIHLTRVMRKRVGDIIACINGHGYIFTCEIIRQDKKSTHIKIINSHFTESDQISLSLICSQCRPQYMSDIIEKSTEYGINNIVIYPSEKSKSKTPNTHIIDRWKGIIVASVKQCNRLYLPQLMIVDTIDTYQFNTNSIVFFGSLHTHISFEKHLNSSPSVKNYYFICGPESGFSIHEEKTFISNGYLPVSIHQNTLRASTAASLGIAQLNHLLRFNKL